METELALRLLPPVILSRSLPIVETLLLQTFCQYHSVQSLQTHLQLLLRVLLLGTEVALQLLPLAILSKSLPIVETLLLQTFCQYHSDQTLQAHLQPLLLEVLLREREVLHLQQPLLPQVLLLETELALRLLPLVILPRSLPIVQTLLQQAFYQYRPVRILQTHLQLLLLEVLLREREILHLQQPLLPQVLLLETELALRLLPLVILPRSLPIVQTLLQQAFYQYRPVRILQTHLQLLLQVLLLEREVLLQLLSLAILLNPPPLAEILLPQ